MYFKVLVNGNSCNGGFYHWSLPQDGKPGDWTQPLQGHLVPCHYGYHVVRDGQLFEWLCYRDQKLYVAEIKYKALNQKDKVVARSVRLIKEVTLTADYQTVIEDMWMYMRDNKKNVSMPSAIIEIEDARESEPTLRSVIKLARRFIYSTRSCEDIYRVINAMYSIFSSHLGLVDNETKGTQNVLQNT